jgi:hypothetical protein
MYGATGMWGTLVVCRLGSVLVRLGSTDLGLGTYDRDVWDVLFYAAFILCFNS